MESQKNPIKGGEFIVRDTAPSEIFTAENWSEEQRMIQQMCMDFIDAEVKPILDRIDSLVAAIPLFVFALYLLGWII